jgi:Fic family protein
MSVSIKLPKHSATIRSQFRAYNTRARDELLRKVYAPFKSLQEGSPEYKSLAKSGKVWEEYHNPGDDKPYLAIQATMVKELEEIDRWKQLLEYSHKKRVFTTALINEYAHQSVGIEGNNLGTAEANIISVKLAKYVDGLLEHTTSSLADVLNLSLPLASTLLPTEDANETIELRNHILVCKKLVEAALAPSDTTGLNETYVKELARGVLIDTTSQDMIERMAWGKRTKIGEYRNLPIRVRSNNLRIFPYPAEVPALMGRFFEWRNESVKSKKLHPLLAAIHIMVHFTHIHPFLDGNGRVGRCILADHLIRNNLLPVVFQDLERRNYLQMLSDAQDHNPEELCELTLSTQLDMLRTFLGTD